MTPTSIVPSHHLRSDRLRRPREDNDQVDTVPVQADGQISNPSVHQVRPGRSATAAEVDDRPGWLRRPATPCWARAGSRQPDSSWRIHEPPRGASMDIIFEGRLDDWSLDRAFEPPPVDSPGSLAEHPLDPPHQPGS